MDGGKKSLFYVPFRLQEGGNNGASEGSFNMRKATLMCVAIVAMFALATTVQAATVTCGCSGCGSSPCTYSYTVTLGATQLMDYFQVGACCCDLRDVVTPTDWSFIGCTYYKTEPHYYPCTPHGQISPGPAGDCEQVIVWTRDPSAGPGGVYVFGFTSDCEPHDVGFLVENAGAVVKNENWEMPVGQGHGPVHGPIPEPATISLLVLGGLALLRRRSR